MSSLPSLDRLFFCGQEREGACPREGENVTIRYVRGMVDCQFRPIGCVTMEEDGRAGYSLCHPADMHKFTKKLARTIAVGRMRLGIVKYTDDGTWYRERNGGPVTILPLSLQMALSGLELERTLPKLTKESRS